MDRYAAGFIAQELMDIIPYTVTTGPDGMHDYFNRYITAINTAAIQELDNAMAAQVARVDALEDRVATLET